MAQGVATRSRHESRAAAIYERVRDLIVDGRMAPGSRIIETDVVEHLGVSRTSVRSALQQLAQEGLVKRLGGGRTRWFVSPLTRADVDEIAGIMSVLEGLVGRRAAELPRQKRRQLAVELRAVNDQLRALAKQQPADSGRAADLDADFHNLLVAAAAGPRLAAFCDLLKPQVARYVRTYLGFLAEVSTSSADEHAAIIVAIERGNPEAAEIAVQANWIQAAERYVEVMDNVGERGAW